MAPGLRQHPSLRDGAPVLRDDGERVIRRDWRPVGNGGRQAVLVVEPAADPPSRAILDRLAHEYGLKERLDAAWAVRPLDLVHDGGRTALILEDAGEPLDGMLGAPMETGRFLDLAIAIASAVDRLHQAGLIHKDIKPANIVLDEASGAVRLTGFGIASGLGRERQPPQPPETIAGTLAYMAPEQTGRMNRSIDSRSDLYAVGITFYRMLVGALPFVATDPMEWVHSHLARRPQAPAERLRGIPGPVSAMVMKLLAKRAEDRYQTAAGLEHDLRRCRAEWQAAHRIADFPLGEADAPDRLLIPEKLYGREPEVETLLAAFDRVVKDGATELVLVSGYSGIGKSSVVNELQPVLVPPRAFFAAGKFDQYKRDIPYSTLAQAFQGLVRPLLGLGDSQLGAWREALGAALGPNGQLVVDLVPELKFVIGEQKPVPELPPQEAQRRFQLVLRRFLGVFAGPGRPLALFLDDLQWLDAATLDLLEDWSVNPDVRHLLLIGAYRDNEVSAAHPLMRKLEAIRARGTAREITLRPLTAADLGALIADTLRIAPDEAAPLASLVHEKTAGNPFFAIQFLHGLADEGLLAFVHTRGRWSFDVAGIEAKHHTDNVVELLAAKLTRLPPDTQDALRQFSCLGNAADAGMLAIALGIPEEDLHTALREALRQQTVERLDRSYAFVHDRVQEAAYALIPEAARPEAHLAIGRRLAAHLPPPKRDEAIFEIANQLNRGAALIASPEEREQAAELNLAAGKRAKASSAYVSALSYLATARTLLPEAGWQHRHDQAFEIELHTADCEVCTGALQAAEERLVALAGRAAGTIQQCTVARRRVDLYAMLGVGERAVPVALDCLRRAGIDWPSHPGEEATRREYERIWSLLGDRTIEDVVDLPLMRDPEALAILELLTKMSVPAEYVDDNLVTLSICRATNLSLEHGNSDAAPVSYAAAGMIASARFGHHDRGYRLARMACDLVDRRGLDHFGGRAYNRFAVVVPWTRPLAEAIDPARRAFELAKRHGEPSFAAYSCRSLVSALLAMGHPLDRIEDEAEQGRAFVLPFGFFLDRMSAPLALVRTLRGKTAKFGSLDDGPHNERAFEALAIGQPALAFLECYYWIRKLQARFFAGDYPVALEAAEKVDAWYATSPSLSLLMLEETEYHFYAALTRAALCGTNGSRHRTALEKHAHALRGWAATCPENFEDRALLVAAEIAGIEGRQLDAMDLHERAIAAARANDFIHDEAIANEVAARFHAARGSATIANAYLREARSCYLRWGADGKVRHLDALHPFLREPQPAREAATLTVPVGHLDSATVVKLSQAISGEMELERLVDVLMRLSLEHAGAERGVLLLMHGTELRSEAEALTRGEDIVVRRPDGTEPPLPDSVVQVAVRARQIVLLDDASRHSAHASDPYVREYDARSVLCLPLVAEAKVTGVLYLENSLAPDVFTPDRVAVLKVLASQAAIAIENSRLYRELAQSERRLRSAIDGIPGLVAMLAPNGDVQAINRQIVEYCGISMDDLKTWEADGIIHPEDVPHLIETFGKAIAAGVPYDIEARLRRFDGAYRWFDIRGIPVRDGADCIARWYVLLTDVEDRMQALTRLHQMQSDFAHMNRLGMMGELAASLSHEIMQPIASARNNARAAQNFLGRQPPDLDEVREALDCIMGDADRAGNIVDRIRDHIKKAPPRKSDFDLNAAIGEVIVLARSALVRNGVAVQTRLADGPLSVYGDRVQLQQVVLNLVLNAAEAIGSAEGTRELSLTTERDPTGILVAVRDTGPGIDAEQVERVFDAFYTTKSTGVGMGLAICRSIIDAHGGRLWAEPNHPRGAVFQFTVPGPV